MIQTNKPSFPAGENNAVPNYLARVLGSDSFRKGVAAAAAGALIAIVSEALWPTRS